MMTRDVVDRAVGRSSDDVLPVEPSRSTARRAAPRLALVRLALDVLAVAGAAALAFPLRFRWHLLSFSDPAPFDLTAYLVATALWTAGVLGAMATHRMYEEDTLRAGGGEFSRLGHSVLEGVALVSTGVFLLRFVSVSRGWFLFVVTLTIALLGAERRLVRSALTRQWSRGRLRRPCVLVTTEAADSFEDLVLGEFRVVSTVNPAEVDMLIHGLRGRVSGERAPVVVVDSEAILPRDDMWRLVMEAGHAGSAVFLRSPFRSLPTERLSTRSVGGSTMVKVSPPMLRGWRAVQKRLLDLVVASALLAVLAVPMAIVALAVLVTAGRPILHSQHRVGKDDRPFRMWKFRTMTAEPEGFAPVWSGADDPRRTRLGRFLRRYSLDEMPQLWNVLRGDMSMVGPRPERPMFVAKFSDGNPWYGFRHRIRPGITGLSQVRGLRGSTELAPRIEADNWYIEHWSLGLDLAVSARTLAEVIRGRGAG